MKKFTTVLLSIILVFTFLMPLSGCFISEFEKPITKIEASLANMTMFVGDSHTFTVSVTPFDTDEGVIFDISDESVIEIENSNKIVAKKKGTSTLKIQAKTSNVSKTYTITVINLISVTGIQTTLTDMTLYVGDTFDFLTTVSPSNANENIDYDVADTSIIEMQNKSKITAKKAGETTIQIFAERSSVTKTVTITVIELIPITKIETTLRDMTIYTGDTYNFASILTPTTTNDSIVIEIEDERVVEFQNENELLGKAKGITRLHVRGERSNISKTYTIKVVNKIEVADGEFLPDEYHGVMYRASVTVYCRFYDKDDAGQEINVKYVQGDGAIIKKIGGMYYFATSSQIFDNTDGHTYQAMYIGRLGQFGHSQSPDISSLYVSDSYQDLAIGTFSTDYELGIFELYDGDLYWQDYAISTDVRFVNYYILEVLNKNYFKHLVASIRRLGSPVINEESKLIGIDIKDAMGIQTSISSKAILETLTKMGF